MEGLKPNTKLQPRQGPVVVCILDGFGIDKEGPGNCVTLANPPYYNKLLAEAKEQHLHTIIKANGPYVGLPTEADMGNSEVGHNALGAGQIYSQGTKLVEESIESGKFFETENWKNVVGAAVKEGKTVHFIGLLSDGNVHSNTTQLFQMMDGVVKCGGNNTIPCLKNLEKTPQSIMRLNIENCNDFCLCDLCHLPHLNELILNSIPSSNSLVFVSSLNSLTRLDIIALKDCTFGNNELFGITGSNSLRALVVKDIPTFTIDVMNIINQALPNLRIIA
ncbi:2,3-bisphosphoglycerate-independent phosphoglycerate mutase putative [Entamoeba histolytica]|uniref:phosphoglycerate mutase (2,3-diphosphoglycerate-independent) n=1 Tax=Entamoeba histolytica TaxID=5759 RepID=A0A175K0L9_ENTHI|nr:2,3-bisphosphoglycerate-independent phosphoglycerate mutase putative [Entamoeba histolytica]